MRNGVDGNRTKEAPLVRCAIYTRKSTEEGLEKDFNSLEAQREAAESYIQSQRYLGWILVPQHYDDGGFTGANLERPALQDLLADVESGQVDCVVVYKVDRLSRSLLDFARLVDRFDQRSVNFVSVTQQFNTTTSIGRLTLNILLSFAQFEREIIGERTRDKMSAARRKGKWVGGTPVLGYDVDPAGGRLLINEKEARRVREIFALYRSHHSLTAVVSELNRKGWKTKSWKSKSGMRRAGRPFTKDSLRRMLMKVIYAGKIEHRGVIYAGEHTPIVDEALWDAVNAGVRTDHRAPSTTPRTSQNPLLTGLLICVKCQQPMIATYTLKRGKRFRYYVCQTARQKGRDACLTKSLSARIIEDSIVDQLRAAITAGQIQIAESEWQEFAEGDPATLIRTLVEEIRYQGSTGAVSLKLRSIQNAD
jgi:site-specific DNA recombinase